MSGGYLFHPSSTEAFRARSDSKPMGITNYGWQCQWCLKRTAVISWPEEEPAWGAGWICVSCSKKGKEVKKKRLWKLARMVEQIAVMTEDIADAVQHQVPTNILFELREAVRSFDDATFTLDEMRAMKK